MGRASCLNIPYLDAEMWDVGMQNNGHGGREPLDDYKCIICGYRKMGVEAKNGVPLCGYCNEPKFYNILAETVADLDDQVSQATFIDSTKNPLLSFVADIGMMCSEHNFMTSVRTVLGQVLTQIGEKGITDAGKVTGRDSIDIADFYGVARFRDIARFFGLLSELGLIEFETEEVEGKKFVRRIKPTEGKLITKVAATSEAAGSAEVPTLERGAAFTLGWVTLHAMKNTIELVHKNGKLYYGEGLTKLYPIDKNNRVMVVKGFTAPVVFILWYWARQMDQFSEYDLQRYLGNRGLSGRRFRRIVAWLSGGQTSSVHVLYKHEPVLLNGVPVLRFTLNREYVRMRDRILQRIRDRERERAPA